MNRKCTKCGATTMKNKIELIKKEIKHYIELSFNPSEGFCDEDSWAYQRAEGLAEALRIMTGKQYFIDNDKLVIRK